jgi:hypothetical protein
MAGREQLRSLSAANTIISNYRAFPPLKIQKACCFQKLICTFAAETEKLSI